MILRSATVWGWTDQQLKPVGLALRYETEVHHLRHRLQGRPGLLLSEQARKYWGAIRDVGTLYAVEGLTDFCALGGLDPGLAVVGCPGSWGYPQELVLRRLASRPRRVVVLGQRDPAGVTTAQKIAAAFARKGCRVETRTVPRRGGGKDVADVLAACSANGMDPRTVLRI